MRAPSGMARSRTGISRLDSQNAALVRLLRCSMLCLMSSRWRMPQNVGMSPTALYGSIIVSPMSSSRSRSGRDGRQSGERHRQLLLVVVLVDELALEVADIGLHVEMPVAGHAEQDYLTLALALAAQCLVDRAAHRVGRFGRRHDSLAARELDAGFEAGELMIGARLDQAEAGDMRHERRHAVIAQAAGMEARRNESRAQRVHFHKRRKVGGVAEVVGILALGQRGAGRRLHRNEAALAPAAQLQAEEGEGEAREIRA